MQGRMQGTTVEMQNKKEGGRPYVPLWYLLYSYVPLVPLVPQCTPCMVNLFHHLYGKPPTFTGAGEPLAEEQVQLFFSTLFILFTTCLMPPSLQLIAQPDEILIIYISHPRYIEIYRVFFLTSTPLKSMENLDQVNLRRRRSAQIHLAQIFFFVLRIFRGGTS